MSKGNLLSKGFKQLLQHNNNNPERSDYLASIPEIKSVQPQKGAELFDQQHYQEINNARLKHLESLAFQLEGKTVIDVGCGPGYLAQFFVHKGCKVTCVDGRKENIEKLRSQYPSLDAHVADVQIDPLDKIGVFDIVFCYGLLYHLENPVAALRNLKSACKELLILETIVCDHTLPVSLLIDEPLDATQALSGLACRPSPAYIIMTLSRIGFPFIYAPKTPPEHSHFRVKWKNNLEWKREGHSLRYIFVASMTELQNPNLLSLIKK